MQSNQIVLDPPVNSNSLGILWLFAFTSSAPAVPVEPLIRVLSSKTLESSLMIFALALKFAYAELHTECAESAFELFLLANAVMSLSGSSSSRPQLYVSSLTIHYISHAFLCHSQPVDDLFLLK